MDHAVDTEAAPEQASRWEDYVDVFFSPVDLFRRRAADRVAPPLITLLILAVLVYLAMMPANAMMMRAAMMDNPEVADAMGQLGVVFQVVGAVIVPITYTVMIAIAAFLLFLVGRFVELRTEFSRTMLIATYAGFIYLISQIAIGTAILLHGEAGLDVARHTSFGPLRFLDATDMNGVVKALLQRLDIFAIWQTVLWGIGIAVIYKASRAQAAITAATAWILFAIPGIIGAALGIGARAAGG
jgi:hypothetical protein